MVSVVVVAYNCVDDLRRCLESLSGHEAIVVDNASSDGSADMVAAEFPLVVLSRNSSNVGFGAANNQGLAVATGEYALMLNPDAVASPGAIDELAAFLSSRPGCVACGGSLWFPDGRLQESAANNLTLWAVFCEQTYLEKVFAHSPLLSPYWVSSKCDRASRVAQIMGACLMMRRVDGKFVRFDERFFLYCEDTELCKRLSKHGEIWYVPSAKFTHSLGATSLSNRSRAIAYYNRGKELFFLLHRGATAASVCFLLDRFGALLRLGAWSTATLSTLGMVPSIRRRVSMWCRVLLAPIDPYTAWRSER